MHFNSGLLSTFLLSGVVFQLVVITSTTDARLMRKRKFDGDFEFADEVRIVATLAILYV